MKNECEVNEVKTDEESYKHILFYYIGYASTKSVKPLYLIINKINKYIEESIRNKYLTLVSTDESKNTLKKYEELWSKICRDCIRSTRNGVHNSKHNNNNNFWFNKTSESRKCVICNYYYFLEVNFSFQPKLWDACRDLMQKPMSFSDVVIACVNPF